MATLLSFLLWAGIVIFMIHVGRNAQSRARQDAHPPTGGASGADANHDIRWVPPEKDVDPVCARTVRTVRAKPSVYDGLVYYFCSRECREIFEAAPDLYVGHAQVSQPELEHSHA